MVEMRLRVKDFNLGHTLECGQFFQFEPQPEKGYVVWSGDSIFWCRQIGDVLEFEGIPPEKVKWIFGLDVDYRGILNSICKDSKVERAIKALLGLRIMRQEFFECLVTYVCSANSNIPKITKNTRLLSKFFGKRVLFRGKPYYLFPKLGDISDYKKVVAAKTGFRARYILEINTALSTGFESRLRSMSYEAARRELMGLPGVGPKVADCVALFSLEKFEAFPVDVWIRRTMQGLYFKGHKTSDKELRQFASEYFGDYCGYANQFLFYAARKGIFRGFIG